MDLTNLTLQETIDGLKKGKFSDQELNLAYLKRIKLLNPKLNAYLSILEPTSGLPVAIKDIICTKGIKTTAASKILEDFIPPYNATVVQRLLDWGGCSILGKTNCDEFAMGSSGENSAYGVTKNPWDLTRVPGGSSSGSAVAVASDLCLFALGTDTGGSVRQPASFCSVCGLKPKYGKFSRYGLISMASSLDCPGVLAKSVADITTVYSWLRGEDGQDANLSRPSSGEAKFNFKDVRVGVPKEYFGSGLDPEVDRVIKQAISKLEALGADIVEITLPHTEYAVAAYYIIMASEVSSNMARFDGIRFGKDRSKFGPEVQRRIMLGTYSLSAGYFEDHYIQAAKVRSLIKQDFAQAFAKCDLIVGPVSPTPAWKIGEKVEDPLTMYLSDIYTVPASLAGIAGLSVPCGFTKDGLPVGLQILTAETGDCLSYGFAYQMYTNWHKQKPKI